MKQKITIYTKSYCPFCNNLKNFLEEKGLSYTDVEVSTQPEIHQKVIAKTGHRTVPAVFVDQEFIGGSEDFYEWFSKAN